MKKLLLSACFLFAITASGQVSNLISTSPSLAQTSVADTHSWTAFHNPAELGYLQNTEFGALFENRFFISQLSTKSVQAAIATDKVNIGIGFSHFGYSVFHEMMLGLGLARNFSDRFSLGVQFNYYTSYFVADNTYRGALLGQAGLNIRLADGFSIGFSTFNPFSTNLKTEITEQKIPSIYSIGTEYFFTDEFVWRTQIDKEISSSYRFATAFDYRFKDSFVIKIGGYGFEYLVPCFGLGFDAGNFAFDLNCELHPVLGINTLGMLKYKLR